MGTLIGLVFILAIAVYIGSIFKKAYIRTIEKLNKDNDSPALTRPSCEKIEYKIIGKNEFEVGSNLGLPLTLKGLSESDAIKIKTAVETTSHNDDFKLWFSQLALRNCIECKELTEWIKYAQENTNQAIDFAIKNSKDFATTNELDKYDIIDMARSTAIDKLPVRPSDKELAHNLVFNVPNGDAFKNELIKKIDYDNNLVNVLVSRFSRGEVIRSESSSHGREELETLYSMGFLLRGKEIDSRHILQLLTMKELQTIVGDSAPKKLTTKQQAIEYLLGLSRLNERLDKYISFREFFTVKKNLGIEYKSLDNTLRYYCAMADAIFFTLSSGLHALKFSNTSFVERALSSSECCSDCSAKNGLILNTIKDRLPPFHIVSVLIHSLHFIPET